MCIKKILGKKGCPNATVAIWCSLLLALLHRTAFANCMPTIVTQDS